MGAEGSPALGGLKQRALLAVLLLNANEVVSNDRLIDELWGEQPPRTAPAYLQNCISKLRKVLGPEVVETRPQLPALAKARLASLEANLAAAERRRYFGQPR